MVADRARLEESLGDDMAIALCDIESTRVLQGQLWWEYKREGMSRFDIL